MLKKLPGLTYLIEGYELLKANKKLWKFCYLPAIVSLVLFIPLMYNISSIVDSFNELIIPGFIIEASETSVSVDNAEGFFATIMDAAGQGFFKFLSILMKGVIWIVSLVIALICYVIVLKIISSPFNDLLSEHIEHILAGTESTKVSFSDFKASIFITLKTEIQRLFIFLIIFVPLWLASFLVIGVGQLVVSGIIILYACFWLTYDAMSYSMDRKLWKLSKRLMFMIKHPFHSTGFGFCLYVIAIIPLLNMFLMPLFVSGGTLMIHELHQDEVVK